MKRTLIAAGFILTAGIAHAQVVSPAFDLSIESREPDGTVTIRATRIAATLKIDGRLDDEVYRTTPSAGHFVQQEPRGGEPATEPTDIWVFFDNSTLYLAARCWDSHPERMVANELRRDSNNIIGNENIAFILDTFHDKRNGFLFLMNPLGGMLEESFVDERSNSRDWNTVWTGAAARFEQGWTVEMAIPFKSLRYGPDREQVWGLNVNRAVRWKNESSFLAPIPPGGTPGVFRVSRAATLVGLEAPPPSKRIEFKPYAVGKITTDRTVNPAVLSDSAGDVGLDLKYGVTRGLTADVTFNTDFAQVEEDVQQVNLTRFNLFFPEKRDFFLEGQGIFNFAGQTTTGAAGTATDTPILFFSRRIGINGARPVSIIGGGRLTGKAGRYSIGLVDIGTDTDAEATAPRTNFGVMRVRRDILRRSTLGLLLTSRSQSAVVEGSTETYGVDGNFAFYQNIRFSGYVAGTRTRASSGRGISYDALFDYPSDRYGVTLERLSVGEHFNPEVGFMRRSNFDKTYANLRFSPRPRSSQTIRKFYYEAHYSYLTTGNTGRLESRDGGASYRIEFQNGDRLNLDYSRFYERLDRETSIAGTRIPAGSYGFHQLAPSYQLGQRRRVSGTVTLVRGSFYDGNQTGLSYSGRVFVTERFAVEPTISFNWIDLPQRTFTTRLVSTRATLTITPRMFISALPQYNSSINSLTNNFRFRWEFQPGSELFVVYSEGRSTEAPGAPMLQTRGFVVKVNRLFRM